MNRLISIILLILTSAPSVLGQQDPTAEPYLQKVALQFSKEKCYEVKMDYIRVDEIRDQAIEGEGTITVSTEVIDNQNFLTFYVIWNID